MFLLFVQMASYFSLHTLQLFQILDIKDKELIQIIQKEGIETSNLERVIIAENLTKEQLAKYIVEKERWPSTSIKAQLKRFSIFGTLFSHVIGYVGPVSTVER